jgi:polyvinyl alcohol dehydrogenase (cytochrome)
MTANLRRIIIAAKFKRLLANQPGAEEIQAMVTQRYRNVRQESGPDPKGSKVEQQPATMNHSIAASSFHHETVDPAATKGKSCAHELLGGQRQEDRPMRPRRTGYLFIVAAIVIVLAWFGTAGASVVYAGNAGSWPAAGHDLGNTRDVSDEHVIGPGNASKLTPAWSITTSGVMQTTPTVDDGTVYFPDYGGTAALPVSSGNLRAVNGRTGQALWSRTVGSYLGFPANSRTSPAVFGPELIFGETSAPGHGAFILAVDRYTGALLWKTQVDTHPAAISTSSPVIYRGVAYLGISSDEQHLASCCSFRGSVVALNATTGQILWKTYTVPAGYTGDGVWGSTPAVDPADNMLYVGTGPNYSVPAGVCSSPGQTGCSLPAADDYPDSVLDLDLRTGAILWSKRTLTADATSNNCVAECGPDFDFGSGPNLIRLPSGRLLVGIGQKSGVYWAMDPRTGAVVWRTQVGPGSDSGGIMWGSATDGGHVYVAISNINGLPYSITSVDGHTSTTDGGSWAALDAATGKILWQVADPQRAADMGYVSTANGLVYAGSTADTGDDMYALDASTGRILWSFAGGGPVVSGAAIVGRMVYWGVGYNSASTRCPGGTGPIQGCAGSGEGLYAFTLPGGR